MADKEVNPSNHHICGNCDTPYVGNFCPECGQSKTDFHRPFSVLLIDLLGNMYAFDTRLFKTLKSVFYKPGEMALDYLAGKRVRYMPPFRLYIFVSLIFFLLLNYHTIHNLKEANKQKEKSSISIETNTKNNSIEEKKVQLLVEDIQKNPNQYITKFYNYFSWSLFLLMPLYGFLSWVFFKKTQPHYLGHLIFSICQHTFIFIIFFVIILTELLFPHKQINPESWLLLSIPLYTAIGSKKMFNRRWGSIIRRLTAIWLIYFIAIAVVIAIIILTIVVPLIK